MNYGERNKNTAYLIRLKINFIIKFRSRLFVARASAIIIFRVL